MATIDRRGATVDSSTSALPGGPTTTLAIKAPVVVTTTAAITLSGIQTIDGVSVGANSERVLVKDQADHTTNGIYVASSGNWTLATDANSNTAWSLGTLVVVMKGTAFARSIWALTCGDNPIVIGSSLMTFTLMTASPTTT